MHTHHFFQWNIDHSTALVEHYNVTLVILSYVIAALAGFCALSISYFISGKYSVRHTMLKVFGGCALGVGIWAMHFIGMLALTLPIEVRFQADLTLFSIIPAMFASTIALHITQQQSPSNKVLIVAAFILSSGIATMHFIGMSAMSMHAIMVHSPILFALALAISWLLATVTMFIQFDRIKLKLWEKSATLKVIVSAFSFGFSVATMHYLAMWSVYFIPLEIDAPITGIDASSLMYSLIVTVVILLCTFTLVLFYKRKVQILSVLASTHYQNMLETIEDMEDPFMLFDSQNKLLLFNRSYKESFHQVGDLLQTGVQQQDIINKLLTTEFSSESKQNKDQILHPLPSNLLKLRSDSGKWWMLRQNLTSSGNKIHTWTDISEQQLIEKEILDAKNQAQSSLLNLQKTQDELVETKKLASLGNLVSNIAHELNTPLGIAITSLSAIESQISSLKQTINNNTLSKKVLTESIEHVVNFQELAARNLERSNSLIQQFKFISMDQQSESLTVVKITKIIEHVAVSNKDLLAKKHVELKINVDPGLECYTYSDGLFQVLNVLVSNSLTHGFSEKCGEQQPFIAIDANINNEHLFLHIKDNGCGIPNDIQNKIYEPFVGSKRNEGSIGLGLHIAFNFVTLRLNGRIELIDSDTTGTEFRLEIPIQPQQDDNLLEALGI